VIRPANEACCDPVQGQFTPLQSIATEWIIRIDRLI